jgi:hypothetical protein
MSADWSREEVEATVSDYFEMLAMELRLEPFNKSEHSHNLQKLLNGRTIRAIEAKHQNISAVLIELGCPYIAGYKPYSHYQGMLRSVVADRLAVDDSLQLAAESAVTHEINQPPTVADVLKILVETPKGSETNPKLYDKATIAPKAVKKNYLEIESRNQTLGLAGENLILEFEYKRLWTAGCKDLANRIEHVAVKTDSLGFDIKSFETNGRERLIEVKTTRFGSSTPFFASINEVEISETRETDYQLYRLFNFTKDPKLFLLPGSLRNSCKLDPIQFLASYLK